MLGDGVPLPVTAETPARILRTVEKENSYGGRRLSSATISKGGVTVRKKGVLEVLDGGSLEIVTGDLILAAGMIKADMLKEHLFPEVYSVPRRTLTSLNGARGDTWGTPQTIVTAPAPAWANNAIVLGVLNECLVVDNNFARAYRAACAIVIDKKRYTPASVSKGGNYSSGYNLMNGESFACDFLQIPAERKISIGYSHQIVYPEHINIGRSWVEEKALIFWM